MKLKKIKDMMNNRFNNNPKISVIIPVYNVEDYLEECLDSIINQTFKDLEIICINDGSQDNSLNILEEYAEKDNRIKIITTKNQGLSAARNRGLENITGDYVYFIDSDDYLELTAFEELYALAEEKSLDLIHFKFSNFNEETGEKSSNLNKQMQTFEKTIGDKVFDYKEIKEFIIPFDVTVFSKFFKRSLIKDMRFEEGCIFEDNLFYINYIFKAKRIYFYNKSLHNRRIRTESIIHSGTKNHVDVLKIHNLTRDMLLEYGLYEEFKDELFKKKILVTYSRFQNVNPKFKEYFFNEIKKDYLKYQKAYEEEIDFKKISPAVINKYESALTSNSAEEYEEKVKNFKKNKK